MLASCCVLMMSLSLQTTCLSLFTKPVTETLGFPRAAFTAYVSILSILVAVAMPFWGRVLPRLGMKRMVCIGGAVTGVVFMLFAGSGSLWQFYAGAVAIGFVSPGITVLPAAVAVNNWFAEKRGLAMGIAVAFSGVGSAIFSPVLTGVIAGSGWQQGYTLIGILTFALTLPIGLFVLRESPDELGMQPYGAEYANGSDAVSSFAERSGVTLREAVRSFPFYGVLLSVFIASFAVVSLSQHIPAFLVSRGVPEITAGNAMSLLAVVFMIAKVGFGWLNDRVGTLCGVLVCYGCGCAGLVLLDLFTGATVPLVPLIVVAFGIPITTVWPPLLTVRMFGQKSYSEIFAYIQAAAVLGYGLGTPVYGLSYDMTGAYDTMLLVSAALMPAAIVMICIGMKSSARLLHKAEVRELGLEL
jgi:MFS family permease